MGETLVSLILLINLLKQNANNFEGKKIQNNIRKANSFTIQ